MEDESGGGPVDPCRALLCQKPAEVCVCARVCGEGAGSVRQPRTSPPYRQPQMLSLQLMPPHAACAIAPSTYNNRPSLTPQSPLAW